MQPTVEQFRSWTKGQTVHPYYNASKEYAEAMKVHALGRYADKLIEERRPSESREIKEYRKKIFVSPTMGTWHKVYNSLTKIRKASDYTITFDASKVPARISEEETPAEYLMEYFPRWKSIDNWFWSSAFHRMLVDSNAVCLVMPEKWMVEATEYLKPIPVIFESDQIIDYNSGEFYFFLSEEVTYIGSGRTRTEGRIYYYVDKEGIYKYTQTDNKGGFSVEEYLHGLGYCPVVSLHGVIEKDNNLYSLCRSRIHGIMQWLNEAVREYSDLQAGVVQSMFPTMWAYNAQKCNTCGGIGTVIKKAGTPVKCTECSGRGSMPFNPYEHVIINPPKVGEAPLPNPFIGTVEKDTGVIEIQDKRIDKHLFNALKAVNMEHLDSSPIAQSGVAKEWDRSEANNFVYMVAEDAVRILDEVCKMVVDYRYQFIVSDTEERKYLQPKISVPTKFDITTDAVIAQDIQMMKTNKFNQLTIAAAEVEYISRRFITDDTLKDMVVAMYQIDGLAGKSEDDIVLGVTNGFIRKEAAIVHANIKEFIERAMSENMDFMSLPLADKKAIVYGYATEQMQGSLPSARVAALNAESFIPTPPVEDSGEEEDTTVS